MEFMGFMGFGSGSSGGLYDFKLYVIVLLE